ncbi:ATP-binding protein [Streptomyces sp. NPDC056682]|uniref:ATP-binding protein n=1 Tax=Streptomyces sp. NPDC056682 TaxID=3345909 RepID=UPI0036A01DA6
MCAHEVAEPRLRCVLPFEADPAELRVLRSAVRERLAAWGASGLADEVQLAVTELATNVIKHVGEGVAATLVLEPSENRLRIEVHDKSHVVPTSADPGCGDDCGRGLHLLAAMALDWGTILTATGKAVWCEIAMSSDGQCRRVQRATAVLESYQRITGGQSRGGVSRLPVLEASATHLIADLLHWLAAQGGDPDTILDQAQMHFEAEAA